MGKLIKFGRVLAGILLAAALTVTLVPVGSAQAAEVSLSSSGNVNAQVINAFKNHQTVSYSTKVISQGQVDQVFEYLRMSFRHDPRGIKSAATTEAIIAGDMVGLISWKKEGLKWPTYRTGKIYGTFDTTVAQNKKAEAKVNACVKAAKKKKTKAKKIAYCYDWTMKQLKYTKKAHAYSAAKSLVTGKAVCQDYAATFAACLRKLGIDARIVTCNLNGKGHMIVKVGSKYYDASSEDNGKKSIGKRKYFAMSKSKVWKKNIRW